MMKNTYLIVQLLIVNLSVACTPSPKTSTVADHFSLKSSLTSVLPELEQQEFNRLAALENIPLYWALSEKHPRSFVLQGLNHTDIINPYIVNNTFTPQFEELMLRLINRRRIEAVEKEINAGWSVVLITDFQNKTESEKKLVFHISKAAQITEALYQTQVGITAIAKRPTDTPSRTLLARNQSYLCQGPKTRHDPFCHALIDFTQMKSNAYPNSVEQNQAFCEQLQSHPNSKELMNPFKVVRMENNQLITRSYLDVYGEKMREVAKHLNLAAQNLDKDEAVFHNYLLAAAKGFNTNQWDEADEAWIKMNSKNSKWYLRIAPDEVYFDPCNSKAGFHTSFGRIDRGLLAWQEKISPFRDEMETGLAELIGEVYEARSVSFSLPDFISILLNAGDARHAFGATVGQALPNWGPVAERGDGRTVVMTNFYESRESKTVFLQKANLLLHPENVNQLSGKAIASYLDILLHEAMHNFGPHSDYKINNKSPREIFGGLNASILEELKAQTGALWLIYFLEQREKLTKDLVLGGLTDAIMWCFEQMSRGLFAQNGKRQVYPTIAAIQIGFFMQEGAVTFAFDESKSPNTADAGRFVIHHPKLKEAVFKLMRLIGQIKATGNQKQAEALIEKFTNDAAEEQIQLSQIADRILRFPKETFRYSLLF